MSQTLTTTEMVARLQRKFPLGLGSTDCLDFLNEGFRKIDQFSKAGFLWQVARTTLTIPAGVQTDVVLPTNFDPGKSAWLRGTLNQSALLTVIPYKSFQDFYNQEHFQAGSIGQFSAWTFVPTFTGTGAGNYIYSMRLAPQDAFPIPAGPGLTMQFTYHKVLYPKFVLGDYFPTPDQFDSLIIDLAEAELARVYSKAGWERIQEQALRGVAEMIDTYRTDKYDLAGLSDLVLQAQERQADKAK